MIFLPACLLSAVVKIVVTSLYMLLDSRIAVVFNVLHHQASCWDRTAGQVGASLLPISCLVDLLLSWKLASLQFYMCASLFQLTKEGPEYRSDSQQLWSYMLDHLPCTPLHVALLFCFPLGKGGHHHSPALQVSLVQGFEEVVQLTLVTDVYFIQCTGPPGKNKLTF